MPDDFIQNKPNPRRPFEAGQEESEKRCIQLARSQNYDWALFIDADEFLWIHNHTTLKEFLRIHDDKTYLSFGKWMYSKTVAVKGVDDIGGYGLNEHPFTPRTYCYGRKGKDMCPTWVGRAKVMVRPELYEKVGVHGDPKGKEGSIHFLTNVSHLKEYPGIANVQGDHEYRRPETYSTYKFDTHAFREAHPKDPDGSIAIYYDRELEPWLKFVDALGTCRNSSLN